MRTSIMFHIALWLWLTLEVTSMDTSLIRKERVSISGLGSLGTETEPGERTQQEQTMAVLPHSADMLETKPRVAVVVLAMTSSSAKWHDAFGVFAYSAQKAFAKSRFTLDLLAVTETSIKNEERAILESLGFKVLAKPVPVPAASVQSEFARQMLTKGCDKAAAANNACEEEEMLKLYGIALTEYNRVVICDGDLLFLQSFDELMEQKDNLVQTTYDHELDFRDSFGFTNNLSNIPLVNSGFTVLKPNQTDFDSLVVLAKEGDFRNGEGWKGHRVGWGFGGIGPQGLFAYYYNMDALQAGERMTKAPDLGTNMTLSPPSSRIQPLDRSVYNVIDTPDLQESLEAERVSSKNVKVFHFTGNCQKPWECQETKSEICMEMTDRWWQLRVEFAAAKGGSVPPRCSVGGTYEPVERS